jgi:hypothetical protein
MANKRYDIHNPTPAPRVIYDANMVAVGIPSGGTTPNVELTDVHAKELQERTKEKPDADVTLTVATGTSARDTKEPVKENEDGAGGGEGGAKAAERIVRRRRRRWLIAPTRSSSTNGAVR